GIVHAATNHPKSSGGFVRATGPGAGHHAKIVSRQLSPFLIFFLLLFAIEGALISAAAKEVFKDEAGRVIYTIDENGIVSMFENSPTDLTLSVKRGTVEQMRPRLEGVAPATVAAGSSTTLKLRGKNSSGRKSCWAFGRLKWAPTSVSPRWSKCRFRSPQIFLQAMWQLP